MDLPRRERQTSGPPGPLGPHRGRGPIGTGWFRSALLVVVFGFWLRGFSLVGAAAPSEAFDAAARLYEQGKFREAALAYQKLATEGFGTVSVLFNQGNAWFKAGQKGRGIVCFRKALEMAPRDSEISANLDWARTQVGAGGRAKPGALDRFEGILTPNEWAAAGLIAVWGWFGWMMVREGVPKLRGAGRTTDWVLAAVAVALLAVAFLARSRSHRAEAVVIASEATVRYGPLEEAQTAFTLADGAEVCITDLKGEWMEIRDGNGRRGWMAGRNLARIR